MEGVCQGNGRRKSDGQSPRRIVESGQEGIPECPVEEHIGEVVKTHKFRREDQLIVLERHPRASNEGQVTPSERERKGRGQKDPWQHALGSHRLRCESAGLRENRPDMHNEPKEAPENPHHDQDGHDAPCFHVFRRHIAEHALIRFDDSAFQYRPDFCPHPFPIPFRPKFCDRTTEENLIQRIRHLGINKIAIFAIGLRFSRFQCQSELRLEPDGHETNVLVVSIAP